jgi:hypothetical protein
MSEPIRKPDENPSRVESILSDTIGLSGYEIEAPRSRIEILLLELEELIKEGGGESSNYGTSILIEMDSNFVMSASLLNKDGEVLGEVQTVDLPLESVVVNGSYDSINKQVVLTLQNGSAVRFSVADLVDGLQTEITSQNPLDADLVDDSTATHKFATAAQLAQIQTNKTALDNKADKSTTYTKTEVDTALDSKQNTISDLSTIRSGAALGATAVQPETGKGLSTNDYTDSEKSKLAGIEAQANKTTVDDALSDSSTNPVQNKVVKTALDSKADASTTYTKTEVNTALSGKQNTIDSSHKLSADIVDDTSATHKFATEAQIAQIETNKNNILTVTNQSTQYNLLFYNLSTLKSYNSNNAIWNENVCTIGNISFTINDDMSITVSGSSDNNSVYFLLARDISFPAIRFQGCPAGGGANTYQLQAYYSSTPSASLNDNGSGVIAEANSWSEIEITIRPNQTISNPITFFPMVIPQSLYDSGFTNYQPYAMSNAELTAKEQANENNISYNTAMGVKNLVSVAAQTYSQGNVDLSIDSNGICTISLSSGTTTNTQFVRTIADLSSIRANINYRTILSGCPSGGNYSNGYALYISNSGSTAEKDEGNGVTVQPNQAVGASSLAIIVRNGTTISSPLVFKPMLRAASISDSTYQPYAPSNRELYEMILALQ